MAKRKPITSKSVATKNSVSGTKKASPRKKSHTVAVKKKSATVYSAKASLFEDFQTFSNRVSDQVSDLGKSYLKKARSFIHPQLQKAHAVTQSGLQRATALKSSLATTQKTIQHQITDRIASGQQQLQRKQLQLQNTFQTKRLRFGRKTALRVKKFKKAVRQAWPISFFTTKKKTAAKTKKALKKPKPKKVVVYKRKRKIPPVFKFIWQEIIRPFGYLLRYYFWGVFFSLLLTGIILGSAYYTYDFIFRDLPDVRQLTTRKQILTTKILDRNGQLLYRIYKDENRTLIPLSKVPLQMREATIAIEDKEFMTHRGVSVRGIIRALRSNMQGESTQGGSTITQQLVKNTLLSPERTVRRKIRELVLSFLVEGTYSKEEILEMYFNQIPYGGSTYGVEEAAQRYFGKSAKDLSLAESAFLAGLPAAPSVYSPFGPNANYAYVRQHEVLRRMVEDGYISEAESDAAKKETLKFREDTNDIKAPHFVMYVRNLLAQKYGEDVLNQGGLEVRTTLDLPTHNQAQKLVTDEVTALSRLHITNGAASITNPQTGEILSMVGSKNFFDFQHDGQVNVTVAPRQPGSSIKPLTYSIAFSNGQSPSTTIKDEPTTFSLPGSAPYSPKNYDGRFHGTVTLREALGSSYNIPAVKTLASIGISTMVDKGEEMGIKTWGDRSRFGLSLTLGGGEVRMIDLAQIYGTFANNGETVETNPILEIKNQRGEVLYHNSCALEHINCPSKRTLNPLVAYQITDVLSDNNARIPAFGPHSVLYIPGQQVAVKTGTTNNLKDNWTLGYTNDRVVATWVGNNDGSPMSYVASGITGASPIWNKIMRTQLDDAHPHVFPIPEGLIKVKICAKTGTLPCTGCPVVRDELFTPGTEPQTACNPAQFLKPKPSPQPGQPTPGINIDKILNGATTGQ